VVRVGMGNQHGIDGGLVRFVVLVEPRKVREEPELQEVLDLPRADPRFVEESALACEVLSEVKEDPCLPVLEEELVPSDLVHAAEELELRHVPLAPGKVWRGEKPLGIAGQEWWNPVEERVPNLNRRLFSPASPSYSEAEVVMKAHEFAEQFVSEFEKAVNSAGSSAWLYYQKDRELRDHGGGLLSSDWTPMMITFLDGLAWHLHKQVQLYERDDHDSEVRGNRDCIWINGPSETRLVAIEAENAPETVFDDQGKELSKLITDSAPLKVLVTYHADNYANMESAEAWRDSFLRRVHDAITNSGHQVRGGDRVEFLLILGDRVRFDPKDWSCYSLRREGGTWSPWWESLSTP